MTARRFPPPWSNRGSHHHFDYEATRLMGEAFDAACKEIHNTGQPTPALIHQIIATRIISTAGSPKASTRSI